MRILAALAVTIAIVSGQDARPNVVLIMADDMGFSDVGCYGSEIRTPNIDGLASEGLRFRQFYNNAKCTTTRASLLTGLYPRNGGRGIQLLNDRMVTAAEAMASIGYATGMSGKWHLGSRAPHRPFDRGFETYYGLMDGCCNFFDPVQPDPKFKGGRIRVFGDQDRLITDFPDDFYTTDAFTDHAIQTVKRFAKDPRPFFVHVAYTAPHYPLHAKPEDIARCAGRYDDGWEALREDRWQRLRASGFIPEGWAKPPMERRVKPWAKRTDTEWDRRRMEVYAAMVESMDRNIGRLLEVLEKTGVADNTLVIFISDNGGCAETPGGNNVKHVPGPKEFYSHCGPGWAWAQNTPFRWFKARVHEGGIATPCVMRWPKRIKKNSWTDAVGHIIDLLPTFLDMAGTDPAKATPKGKLPLDGLSLLPVLVGGERPGHEALYWNWAAHRAVRVGDWKLIGQRNNKPWELFHMGRDRTETQDVSAAHPERVARMKGMWEAWGKKTGVR